MKIIYAQKNETLRTIAANLNIDPQMLLNLNPDIKNLDQDISGIQVNIPEEIHSTNNSPPVCYPELPKEYQDYWIPVTPLEKMAIEEYDVLIVGSGAGGGAALYNLCEKWKDKGKKIGMIESGGPLLPTHAQNIPTLEVERFQQYFLNPKISTPIGSEFPEFPGARLVFALGGRTLFWSAVCPRMNSVEFNDWPITYEDLIEYYNKAEELMNVNQEFTRDSLLTSILLDRLKENGFTRAINLPIAADISQSILGRVKSDVFFSSISFLAKSLNLLPYDLSIYSRAVEILVQNNKVEGVKVITFGGKQYTLRAKTIILSAGTIETPRILLNSNIEGKAIGHYLVNHSFLEVNGTLNRLELPENLGNLGILVPQDEKLPYQFQLYGRSGVYFYHERQVPLQPRIPIFLQGFGKVESRYENQVTLNRKKMDQFGIPKIDIKFKYSIKDYKLINLIQNEMHKALKSLKVSIDPENNICLRPPGIDYHEMGTCRMGEDPETSVANQFGEVHNVSGLYIADNSLLPNTGSANPVLTTVALALRTTDIIARK